MILHSGKLVDQVSAWTNRSNILDSFDFVFDTNLIKPEIYKELYLKQGLSASQIGLKFNVSKAYILSKLHELGIRKKPTERRLNPQNYRHHNPPYGLHVKDGVLKEYRTEVKVCRLVVSLRNEKSMSFRAIAEELKSRGVRNRQGEVSWHHCAISQIYKRWNQVLSQKENKK